VTVELSADMTTAGVKEVIQVELLKRQNDLEMVRARELYAILEEINPARLDEYIPSRIADTGSATYSPPHKDL